MASITLTTFEDIKSLGVDPTPPGPGAGTHGRLYVNTDATPEAQLYYESDLGTITKLTPGAASAGGWTDTGAFVRLTTQADTVGIGATAAIAGYKLIVEETGTDSGVRVKITAPNDNVMDVLSGADAFSRLHMTGNQFQLGGGAAAVDIALARFAAKQFSVSDAAGGSGAILPLTDLDVDGTLGDATHRWINVFSAEMDMPASAGDPAGTAGVGKLYTKGAGVLTQLWFVDGAGVPHQITPAGAASPWTQTGPTVALNAATTDVVPFADNVTAFGTAALRWSNVLATIFTASDGTPANDATLKLGNPNTFRVGNGAGAAGNMVPESTDVGTLGTTALRWLSAYTASTGGFYVWPVGPLSPNPRARLHVALDLGPGGVTAPNVGLAWESTNVFAITNAGASSGSIVPSVNSDLATAFLGRGNGASQKQWSRVDAVEHRVFGLSPGNTFPMADLGSTSLQFGDGANPADVVMRRFATAPLPSFEFGSGGDTPHLLPQLWNQGTIGEQPTLFKSWASGSFGPAGVGVYATNPSTQPSTQITVDALNNGALLLGPGVAAAPDARMRRVAPIDVNTSFVFDDGAGNPADLFPASTSANGIGQIGSGTRKWALVRAQTITSGDVCFDDQTCVVCGQPFAEGDDLVLRVIRIEPDGDSGQRLTRTVPAHHGCR